MEPRTPAEWKTLFESEAFARQTEYYGPLGVEYTPAGTHLRLWAPTAKQAAVNLYRRGHRRGLCGHPAPAAAGQGRVEHLSARRPARKILRFHPYHPRLAPAMQRTLTPARQG